MAFIKRKHWLIHAAVIGLLQISAITGAQAAVSVGITPTVIINEVLATNYSNVTDETADYEDWVELYNTTDAPIDLAGWGLSNATKNPFRWVFPTGTTIASKGYLRVWMSKKNRNTNVANLHTNFNVDNGVDSVVLSAPNQTVLGTTVDSVTPPFSKPDISWCRTSNGVAGSAFAFCLTPTPNAANNNVTASTLLATPALSHPSGVYPTGVTVTVAGPTGAELRYTLDGSEPIATSPILAGTTVNISATSTLRVVAFKAGSLPSYASTATYVIDSSGRFNGQRQIFVTMNPSDATTYKTKGTAGAKGWKSYLEMVGENGLTAFKGHTITDEAGQFGSRSSQDNLPLDIKFSDAVGTKNVSVTAPLFRTKPGLLTFKKLRLRNAGNDYYFAHLRDQFWQSLGSEAKLAPGAFEPVQVFLNGAYYGMMDLREKEDETLIESYYGVDKDTVDYLSDDEVKNGDFATANFNAMYNFITGNNMATPVLYEQAKTLIDVENLAQDFALHLFAVDTDWPQKNLHYFGMPAYDGKWRYRPHDFDISSDMDQPGFNTLASNNVNTRSYCCYKPGNLMTALLINAEFKNLYANVIADQLNSVLSFEESSKKLTEMASTMTAYIPNHLTFTTRPPSFSAWQAYIERLRTFLSARIPFYERYTQSYLGLSARQPIQLSVNDPLMGTIKVNTLDLSTRLTATAPVWTGKYFPEVPITLEAIPKPGYAFVRWEGSDASSNQVITQTVKATTVTSNIPPTNSITCATENATCTIPAGVTATVWYGSGTNWFSLTGVTNSIACSNGVFGDPLSGIVKSCNYIATSATTSANVQSYKAVFASIATVPAPVIAPVDSQTGLTGNMVFLKINAIDSNRLPLKFTAKSLPAGLDMHPVTGMISGNLNRAGAYASVITVSNGKTSETLPVNWSISNKGDRLVTLPVGITGTGTGLKASYYNNSAFTGNPGLTKVELPAISLATGVAPISGFPTNNWAVRWEGTLEVPSTGTYSIQSAKLKDDGVRVYVDGRVIIDNWKSAATTSSADLVLTAGTPKAIKIEFRDISAGASLALNWKIPGSTSYTQIPLVVFNPDAVSANVSPSVALTTPTNGASYTQGTAINLAATANDSDGTVTKVDFYDGTTLLTTLTSAPYTYNFANANIGTHSLTAKAYDDKGAITTSGVVIINVVNTATNNDPVVSITTPSANTILTQGDPYIIAASANDSDGTIAKVEFYNGTSLLNTLTTAPYTIGGSTATVPTGIYNITAKAYDDKGAVTTSNAVSITVNALANALPVVSISNPSANITLKQGADYSITATANDSDGTITKVEFYDGTNLLNTLTAAPFTISGSTAALPLGEYHIRAKAYDDKGGNSISNLIIVTVTQ